MRTIKYLLTALLMLLNYQSIAQNEDGLVKEFNKILSFTIQPYLHYTTHTSVLATPVIGEQDSVNADGEFYKNGTDFYNKTMHMEMFLKDSLLVEVDHSRKAIKVSKVDISSKPNVNLLPLDNKMLKELFKKRYSIKKIKIDGDVYRLEFEHMQNLDTVSAMNMQIKLQYNQKTFLPEIMEMQLNMKQKITEEMATQLEADDINMKKLIQIENEDKVLVRNQYMKVSFSNISNEKYKAEQIPVWNTRLQFDAASGDFIATGKYHEYEVIKTF